MRRRVIDRMRQANLSSAPTVAPHGMRPFALQSSPPLPWAPLRLIVRAISNVENVTRDYASYYTSSSADGAGDQCIVYQ